jgi:hypothetical protein
MNKHNKISYLELPSRDIAQTKAFFETVFGWSFQDYGPDYTAYEKQGLDCGFYQADMDSRSEQGATLAVFFSDNLEKTLADVKLAGGTIIKDIFDFPGGRRFHFCEPAGNEFAVWSDK